LRTGSQSSSRPRSRSRPQSRSCFHRTRRPWRPEGAVRTDDGQIYVPLGEIVTEVAALAGEVVGIDLVEQLPDDVEDARYVLADSQTLADAQGLREAIDRLSWLSFVISAICLLAAAFVAPSRSRGVLWVGIGTVTAMLLTRLLLG